LRSDIPARLLLVEDDEGDAVLVQACLAEAGFDAGSMIWRRTLADAVPVLALRPACVLLDLGLPDAQGLTALQAIVDVAPDIPVIVLTGRHGEAGTEALAAGAEDYLVKDALTADLLDRSVRYAVERKRAQRTHQQLREARISAAEKSRLERGLLPTPLLRDDLVHCSTYYRPGRDHAVLGGDFYDVVQDGGRLRAVVGDVMGHGPDEAALGVHLRVAWRTLVLAGAPDDEILPALDNLLHAETGGEAGFVTVCDVALDEGLWATLRVAGHPAPLLCADGKTDYLDVQVGPPLGVRTLTGAPQAEPDTGWPRTRVRVGPGSSLILYTDGLLDAYAATHDRDSIGIDEFVGAVQVCAAGGGSVSSWIPQIVENAPHTSVDDSAVVVITTRADEE
jgi:serine phosphatase RsbU (regulator of sigma subunit)